MKKYSNFQKLNEVESTQLDVDLTRTDIFDMIKPVDPEQYEKDYEKHLGREGLLSQHFRKVGKKFTFGVLKSIFKDAIEYKRKREMIKGTYKFLHRILPITLAFVWFPIWILGTVLGTSRALNKLLQPILEDPGQNYNDFLVKFVKGTMFVMEGEIKYIMERDWFYEAFVMKDNLTDMVKHNVLRKFAVELAEKMEKEPDDKEVPHNYIENELKRYLNKNFNITPPMQYQIKMER